MANRQGNNGNSDRLYLGGSKNHCRWWLQPWNLKRLAPWNESCDKAKQHIKKQRHCFANKGPSSQSYGFPSSYVWMLELDYQESWAPKYWYFWIVVLEKTLERSLDSKEIKPVNSKGNQSWILTGGTDAEAKTPCRQTPCGEMSPPPSAGGNASCAVSWGQTVTQSPHTPEGLHNPSIGPSWGARTDSPGAGWTVMWSPSPLRHWRSQSGQFPTTRPHP